MTSLVYFTSSVTSPQAVPNEQNLQFMSQLHKSTPMAPAIEHLPPDASCATRDAHFRR